MSNPSPSRAAAPDRLLESLVARLGPDAAQTFCEFQPEADVQARIDELATKNLQDELSAQERDEYEGAVQILQTLALVRAKILSRPQGAPLLEEASRKAPEVQNAVVLDREDARLEGLEAMLEDMDFDQKP